jgi:thiol-disulfide isomerase/thioredoxin
MVTKKLLVLLFLGVFAVGLLPPSSFAASNDTKEVKLVLFYLDGCPHCKAEKAWLETMKGRYPNLVVELYEVNANKALFIQMADEYNITSTSAPTTFVAGKVFVSFSDEDGDSTYNPFSRTYMGYANQIESAIANPGNGSNSKGTKLILFHSESCPHCQDERRWLDGIRSNYPDLVIEEYEIGSPENASLFERMSAEYNTTAGGVPRTFIGSKVFVGFSSEEGDLVYNQGYKAYIGYSNQIEKSIQECLFDVCSSLSDQVVDISKKSPQVAELIKKDSKASSTKAFINGSYVVGWWTNERMSSKLDYPDLLVYIDGVDGSILKTVVPTSRIPGLDKPGQGASTVFIGMLLVMLIYLCSYLFLRSRVKWGDRYWASGFIAIVIIMFFIIAVTTPVSFIERFAKKFPFPVFVFIIALADGFNPCAFTVLIVLLSLLTHTKSRKKMLLIGGVFVLTSSFMYFLFIMVLTLVGSWIFGQYGSILLKVLGVLVVLAGLINIKDFFFFKKGISLTISDEHRGRIFRHAGKIVKKVDKAESKKAIILALLGTAALAALVNLVELGCTAMLPAAYMSALFNQYGNTIGFYHVFYTAFYSFVYVIPLFAILGDFLYSFKSDRLSENQARILKLVGGLIMLGLGLVLLIKPDLLSFG